MPKHRTGSRTAKPTDIPGVVNPGFGTPYGFSVAYVTAKGVPVYMWRKRQAVRFYDAAGKQHGPEQRNVGPAITYAMAQGWTDPRMPDWFNAGATREVRGKVADWQLGQTTKKLKRLAQGQRRERSVVVDRAEGLPKHAAQRLLKGR